MLPTFRLVLVAVGVALVALIAAGRGLITPTQELARVGNVPGVGRALVQQAIVDNPEAQRFSRLASARRAEAIERLRDLPTTPMRTEATADETAPSPERTDAQPLAAELALRPALAPAAVPPDPSEPARTEPDDPVPGTMPAPQPATVMVPANTEGEPDRTPALRVLALPVPAKATDTEDTSPVPEPAADHADTPGEHTQAPAEATGALSVLPPPRSAARHAKPAAPKKARPARTAAHTSVPAARPHAVRPRKAVATAITQTNSGSYSGTSYQPQAPTASQSSPASTGFQTYTDQPQISGFQTRASAPARPVQPR